MAGISDKFTKAFNITNPNVARVTIARSALGTTLTCDSLTGWPTDTAVHFSTYRLDSTNAVAEGTQIDWKGIVSGNVIGTLTRLAGATDSGNAVADVVEMNPTGSWASDLVDGILVSHNQDGTLKNDAVTTASIDDGAVSAAKQGDSGWINLPYGSNYDGGGATGQYRKIGSVVHLRGQMNRDSGNVTSGDLLGTLPSGYRPPQQQVYQGSGVTQSVTKISVNTDGAINAVSAPTVTTTYVFLDLISFTID